ncbi:A disintegrin and metalloproteinase with thrombospondin motifs 16 [Folsomia candida]|uniref:A disintegrin and metalloproteinase with thrombospondin motifs 16 n=2 Tax=Folsomia candida TaxID=158441 RepID=A0A226DRN7_FOLCA|nr:A disintegrin and metalloproteinase with thrombospondin motifs 16 [Folsomia candida]
MFFVNFLIFSSLTAGILAISAKVDLSQVSDGYRGQIHVENGDSVQLNLKKSIAPVFHPNFKITSISGNIQTDVTPPVEVLEGIENSIFEDPENGAVLRVGQDGTELHGIVGNMRIKKVDGAHEISHVTDHVDKGGKTDYRNIPGDTQDWLQPNFTRSSSSRIGIQAMATVELLIFVDFATYTLFGADIARIAEYKALFIKGVSSIFATNADPTVTLQIVTMIVITSPADQPFVENNKAGGVIVSLEGIFFDFNTYLVANAANHPGYDVAALMTAEAVGPEEPIGIAFVGGGCNPLYKGTVSQDRFASFIGVRLLAHELGHKLGSDHDGELGGAACSQQDRYIMHPVIGPLGGENRFRFSECSKRMMQNFLSLPRASCLSTKNFLGTPWSSPPNLPGDLVDLNAICRNVIGRPNAAVDPTARPDQLCSNVRCQWVAPCNPPIDMASCTMTTDLGTPGPDGAPCGANGKCQLGRCVGVEGPVQPPPVPFTCKVEGTFKHDNCRQYYRCVKIGASLYTYVMTCPSGSYFNAGTSKCVLGNC